ncbi:putative epidermal cell surface receptor [Bombyx mori]|uniref:Fibronectin type-III domain-containing protein n=1 Tax=Bombyx mori TaxID=7091 RepID=A0A8R2G7N0_BOMMO|nr:putative epidermal cell surface receptor isoform X2 [Bombyx mori]
MWAKAMGGRGAALWRVAALLAVAAAVTTAYTVDCNHEYADCDTELSKIANDEEEVPSTTSSQTLETLPPISTPTPRIIEVTENVTEAELTKEAEVTTEVQEAIEPKPQPRLLNLNVDELQNFANALHNQTIEKSSKKGLDLSDVNLDEEDDEVPRIHDHKNKNIPDKFYSNLQAPFHHLLNNERGSDEIGTCKENEISYKIGDHMDRGCEESCECTPGGVFECSPRCKHPYIRSGRRLNDPLCFESPVDSCCSIIACSTGNGDTKPMKLDVCRYGNDTYPVGTKWNIGCEQSCMCEPNSVATCKPRCKQYSPSEKCINVQDPNDACCEIQVCDVSQDVHEEPPDNVTSSTTSASETARSFDMSEELKSTSRPLVLAEPIGSVKVLNNNSVQVNLIHVNTTEDPVHLLLSDDGGKTYQDVELKYSNLILNLDGGKDYILKTKETGTKFNFTITTTAFAENEVKVGAEDMRNDTKEGCYENGKFYEIGEEFHIGCSELCECTGPDKRECAALVCPSHVGLELMSKGCVRWAPSPPAVPPNCCPRSARCLSDGTCHYKGVAVPNWSEVPLDLTGCEQRCFCENGELDCQEVCSPLPAVPPQNFRCPPLHRPAPVNISDEDCCKEWGCVPNGEAPPPPPGFPQQDSRPQQPSFLPTIPPEIHFPQEDIPDYDQNNIHRPSNPLEPGIPGLPPGFSMPTNYGEVNKKLSVISLQADSPNSVKMMFGLPPVLVGLRGSVDLRYTDKVDEDVSQWSSQVFAPADEVLTTPRLEFRLTGLKPSTTYKIRAKLYLHNLPVEPKSEVYTVRTQDAPTIETPVEEKRKEIDSKLTVLEVNDTTAQLNWRRFSEEELQYIDGIQVRYRPVGTPIYSMTELLHHSRPAVELHELRPGTPYEASLVLIPPPRSNTELIDPGRVEFTTAPYTDPYNWSVTVEALSVGAGAVQVSWRGVPAPAERWVRVYRAAHSCGRRAAGGARAAGREHDAFTLAARDAPTTLTLSGLEPDSRCRVWLELFLTNGKVKTSNVLEINTRPADEPEDVDNEIEASSVSGSRSAERGDYYGGLVVAGVLAALGALTSLLLLLVVVRRHRPRSVPITPVPTAPRESSLPPYDNPAYKLELQQETMDL